MKRLSLALLILWLSLSSSCMGDEEGEVDTVEDTVFSLDRGHYDSTIILTISSATPDATIIYTIDGSCPSHDNGVQSAPSSSVTIKVTKTTIVRAMAFKQGMKPTNIDTHTYIFRDQIIGQKRPAAISERIDFEMSSELAKNPVVVSQFSEAFLKVPTVSLVFSEKDIFGPNGIYLNSTKSGELWERATSFEWIDPVAKRDCQADCGGRIQGAASRSQSRKQNFRLNFTHEFGPGELRCKLFETTKVDRFDSVVLRNPTHDSWPVALKHCRDQACYVNDTWAAATQHAMGHLSPHRRWVHLFLNGFYWGLYTLTERPDEDFMVSHVGGKKDDYDVLNANRLRHGESGNLNQLRELVKSRKIRGRSSYESLEALLAIDAFIDYFLLNIYACNVDWPSKNYWIAGKRGNSPQFTFLNWDAEIGFFQSWPRIQSSQGSTALNYDILNSDAIQRDSHGAGFFYRQLKGIPEFRMRFADRLYFHTTDGGILSPGSASARYRGLLDEVEPLLVPEAVRWGDAYSGSVYGTRTPSWKTLTSKDSWLFSEFFPQRSSALIEMFRADAAYPSIDPPTFSRFVGDKGDSSLDISNPNREGVIYYTTDGSDPRKPWTGRPAGIEYGASTEIPSDATVKARVLEDSEWSALGTYRIANNDPKR